MSKHHQQQRNQILPHPDNPLQRALVDAQQAGQQVGLTVALFTAHELEALRTICRDSDNESARRILTAGLDRAASKPVIRPVDGVG